MLPQKLDDADKQSTAAWLGRKSNLGMKEVDTHRVI